MQPVWDRAVRALHWTLVLTVAVAWLSLWWGYGLHQPAGYMALAAVGLRLVWGWRGSRHARFSQFVRGPRATFDYAKTVLRHRDARHVGHNPLGAWMVVALLGGVGLTALTGVLMTTDWFWGDERMELLHRACAWTVTALVPAHVAGVLFTAWRHRENLVRAMFDGRKRAAREGDVS